MIFTNYVFIASFLGLTGVFILLPWQKTRKITLLLFGYFFYSYWDYRFLALLLLSTLANYIFGLRLKSNKEKLWLKIAIIFNLLLLGFFKYYNFFVSSFDGLLKSLGTSFPLLNIALPIGISFYTFEAISYLVDIHRGKIEPEENLLDFSLFMAFFPRMIAGPIIRASDFFPQIKSPLTLKRENFIAGGQMFLLGLVRKVLIADRIAPFNNQVFNNPNSFSSATLWMAVLGYALQIYNDFAGYSDMAIGLARMLGIYLPNNFHAPYLSKNITEFWRRWHISLSTWLKDYLYIPLGGSRKGQIRRYINQILVMLIGGLWHGASWNFVFWGGLHGIALAGHKLFMNITKGSGHKPSSNKVYRFVVDNGNRFLNFVFVASVWVFFRATDFSISTLMLRKMYTFSGQGITWLPVYIVTLAIMVITFDIYQYKRENIYPRLPLNKWYTIALITFAFISLYMLAPFNTSPFIYFKF